MNKIILLLIGTFGFLAFGANSLYSQEQPEKEKKETEENQPIDDDRKYEDLDEYYERYEHEDDDYEYFEETQDWEDKVVDPPKKILMIAAGAGYNMPFGRLGDTYANGFNFGGQVKYIATSTIGFHANSYWYFFPYGQQLARGIRNNFSNWSTNVGISYNIDMNKNTAAGAGFEVGYNKYRFYEKNRETEYESIHEDFGLAPLVIVKFALGGKFSLDMTGSYRFIFGKSAIGESKIQNWLGMTAGVTYEIKLGSDEIIPDYAR